MGPVHDTDGLATLHHGLVGVGLLTPETPIVFDVDTTPATRDIHPIMNADRNDEFDLFTVLIGLIGLIRVPLERRPGQGENTTVTGRINNHIGEKRLASGLAFKNHPAHGVAFLNDRHPLGVQQELHPLSSTRSR